MAKKLQIKLEATGGAKAGKEVDKFTQKMKRSQEAFERYREENEALIEGYDRGIKKFQGSVDILAGSVEATVGALAMGGQGGEWIEEAVLPTIAFADGMDRLGVGIQDWLEQSTIGIKVQKALNAAMSANPLAITIAAFAALSAAVAGFVYVMRDAGDAQGRLNEVMKEAKSSTTANIIQIRAYGDVVKDVNLAEDVRIGALEELIELGVLSKDATLDQIEANDDLTLSIEKVTKSMILEAQAAALLEKIAELTNDINESAEEGAGFLDMFMGAWGGLGSEISFAAGQADKQSVLNALMERYNEIIKELAEDDATDPEKRADREKRLRDLKWQIYNAEAEIFKQEKLRAEFVQKQLDDELAKMEKKRDLTQEISDNLDAVTTQEIESFDELEEEEELHLNRRSQRQVEFSMWAVKNKMTEEDAKGKIVDEAAQAGKTLMSGIAALANEETERGFKLAKAANISGTTIDTIQGAIAAYKAMAGIPVVGPALGITAAAGVTAAGAAAVKDIAGTQFGQGSPSAGSFPRPSTSSFGQSSFGVSPFNVTGAIAAEGGPKSEPVQAYVVEGDITNAQQMARRTNKRSSL